jgi:nicotinate phosphoribosyltransferase
VSRALNTDLYQLTMAAGYFAAGKQNELATFELFVRRMPDHREYLVAAGLDQALEYLSALAFEEGDIAYLQSLTQFRRVSSAFWDYLRALRFTGEVWAMAEGTVFFPNEPILTIRAPIIEAQLVETFLLSTVGFQSMIASKASRLVALAQGRPVVEFGTRRAHSPRAGVLAGRAAYVGGCAGTSNAEAGKRFGIPVYGTCAHSWVLSFASESEAFRRMQELLGEGTVQLLDTYDTAEGARRVASLGEPLYGVRLDSGDTVALARAVRRILDEASLRQARIMVTGDLDEHRIREILNAGAPVDSFGVGTHLAVSADAPSLNAVYKLVELEADGVKRYPAKLSPGKQTVGGAKQVYRLPDRDIITRMDDPAPAHAEPLLHRLSGRWPSATEARERHLRQPRYARPVSYSEALHAHVVP